MFDRGKVLKFVNVGWCGSNSHFSLTPNCNNTCVRACQNDDKDRAGLPTNKASTMHQIRVFHENMQYQRCHVTVATGTA